MSENHSIASTLHYLYEGFGADEKGDDYALGVTEGRAAIQRQVAEAWSETNKAREAIDALEWDGLLAEASAKARCEHEPNALIDRLLELAATAIVYAESVQRQTEEFNAEPKAKK